MTVRRYGFHNGVMAYMLQFGESIILIIFVEWVALISRLLSPEVSNKFRYGLRDIIIA